MSVQGEKVRMAQVQKLVRLDQKLAAVDGGVEGRGSILENDIGI
jgi:hypothetical protein